MIVESPSAELDEVYKSQGPIDGPTGGKDHAPDETSSEGVEKGKISEKGRVNEGVRDEGSDLPEQAKGQGPAPDGTSTPKSMVYSASSQGASASDTVLDAAGPAQSPTTKKDTRHPAMLLSKEQIPALTKAMELRSNEVMDVTRAVEQADGRARAADRRDAEGANGGKPKDEDGNGGKPGTT